jgi:hypothetical protein
VGQSNVVETRRFDFYGIAVISLSRGCVADKRIFLVAVDTAKKGFFTVYQ